ncbi:MAG: DUF4185 domain-containing protein [Polyangia bacterium]
MARARPVLRILALAASWAACSRHPRAYDDNFGGATSVPSANGGEPSSDAGSGAMPDGGSAPPHGPPLFVSLEELCKLITNRNQDDPTANDTHFRFNLRSTDLGIPVAHGGDVFFFFGDSAGEAGIWPLGPQSLPDAVGYSAVGGVALAADPTTLCSNLAFLALSPQNSVGPTVNPSVQRDFAAGAMAPPAGGALADYIHNPAGDRGKSQFPQLPGDFEVPTGGFSFAGAVYLFYSTVQASPVEMKGSYLARWSAPSTAGLPSYDIQYAVDERVDGSGALHGDFINIAAVVDGAYVYLFGTGAYRASPVHLARKRLDTLATAGGFDRWDAAGGGWVTGSAVAAPIVAGASIGELSVRYYAAIDRWVMLDQETWNNRNLVVARFADAPEGPWSDRVIVAEMGDPAFAATYCCVNGDCSGAQLFNCDRAGFYGTYMLPEVAAHADGSFSISFTMSTWDPYNVALMRATFR